MKKYIVFGLIASIILVLFSPLASSFPDGLEKVSEIFNFSHKGTSLISSPMPDYTIPAIKNSTVSTIIAGIIGTLIIFILLLFLGTLLKKKDWLKIL